MLRETVTVRTPVATVWGSWGAPQEAARGCSPHSRVLLFLYALTCAWEHSARVYTWEPHTYGRKKTCEQQPGLQMREQQPCLQESLLALPSVAAPGLPS